MRFLLEDFVTDGSHKVLVRLETTDRGLGRLMVGVEDKRHDALVELVSPSEDELAQLIQASLTVEIGAAAQTLGPQASKLAWVFLQQDIAVRDAIAESI